MIKAISIAQPWAWLIANGYKNIENRKWNTHYRGRVLIHSPKNHDTDCFHAGLGHLFKRREYGNLFYDMPQSIDSYQYGGFVGVADLVDVVRQSDSRWFVGPYGFVLGNARPVPFTPYRGQLYLFDVPDTVIATLGVA